MNSKRFFPICAFSLIATLCAFASAVNFTYDGAGRLIAASYNSATNISYAYDNAGNLLLGSSPAPAIIVGQISPGEITLSWPALPAGTVLQRATDLSPSPDWTDFAVTTHQSGSLIVATIPVSAGVAFYRLRAP